MSNRTKKFYRPGTLPEKGTKLSLKTQPYTNGVVFDTQDPITSFHALLTALKVVVDEYEILRSVPGMSEAVPTALDLKSGVTGRIKLLLDLLAQSPIEIILKEQIVNDEILTTLAASEGVINNERN